MWRSLIGSRRAHSPFGNAAQGLEAKAVALNDAFAKGPAVRHANPQAAAISGLLRIPVDDAVNWYAFVASLALELAAIAALMRAESRPVQQSPREISQKSEERGGAWAPEYNNAADDAPRRRTNLIAPITLSDPLKLSGSADTVGRFMLACLKRAPGEEVHGGAIYARYQGWCAEQRPPLVPLVLRSFAQQFAQRCERVGICTRRDGYRVYCLDVRLVA